MADIRHDFLIKAPLARVYQAISTPEGLDVWWTKRSTGVAREGAEFELWFGLAYDWRANVTRCDPPREFELCLSAADADWLGTRVGFDLEDRGGATQVRFHHTGWPSANEHCRISSYCWAMYLRLLQRFLEHGETVPYEKRLEA
jgi:uncharacterized protein YndB with AHSA1/START domain